jgi:hypothetical protein
MFEAAAAIGQDGSIGAHTRNIQALQAAAPIRHAEMITRISADL